MQKIRNPYVGMEGYKCFGCSPHNENGLQMQFREEGDYLVCDWEPRGFLQGYVNVLHGGIQATLMDEIASWLVQVKLNTAGVTAQLTTKYLKPVAVDKGSIRLRAHLEGKNRNLVDVKVELFGPEEELCSEGMITYYTFPERVARERFHYPGADAFKDQS
ncbi:MAG: PaaI family thioesterase [Bacteroidales bacterium]|nr:PaaI family thioesterase [Bacteroidales bacterium]